MVLQFLAEALNIHSRVNPDGLQGRSLGRAQERLNCPRARRRGDPFPSLREEFPGGVEDRDPAKFRFSMYCRMTGSGEPATPDTRREFSPQGRQASRQRSDTPVYRTYLSIANKTRSFCCSRLASACLEGGGFSATFDKLAFLL